MLKNLYLVCVSNFYYNNKIFDIHSSQNRDHSYEPYFMLKEKLVSAGIDLNTYDYFKPSDDNEYALLFLDIPEQFEAIAERHPAAKKYLVLLEPESWRRNWDANTHKRFDRIFTWNDDYCRDDRYTLIRFPYFFPSEKSSFDTVKTGFCTMIAGNKRSNHPRELYSKRIEAIRWFEHNHPDEFDLYGMGWDEHVFTGPRLIRILNRVRLARRLCAEHYPSYRGMVPNKKEVLSKYRFAICYENMRDLPGWITEKIFDSFLAGCVPVYWGAGNVSDHIPSGCFIDKRKFSTYEQLYDYMKGMTVDDYQQYMDNISEFLNSPRIRQFSAESFADTISSRICND